MSHTARTARKATEAWEDAFDLARWLDTDDGREFFDVYGRRDTVLLAASNMGPGTTHDARQLLDLTRIRVRRSLMHGRHVFVSAHMTALAEQTLDDFGEVPLTVDQMPDTSGWMVFEQPLEVQDVWGEFIVIHACSWTTAKGGIAVVGWTRNDDLIERYGELAASRIRRDLGKYTMSMAGTASWGEVMRAETTLENVAERMRQYLTDPDGYTQSPRGKTVAQRLVEIDAMTPEEILAVYDNGLHLQRILQVVWALCCQSTTRIARPDRHAFKRARRLGKHLTGRALENYLAALEGDVHVMALRTEYLVGLEEHEPTPGQPRFTHQWVVRPHWRWQPYKAEDDVRCEHCGKAGVQHRRILIPPYVKGPEGAPLIEKNRVDALLR